jgi:DNA invertase Pin-like site-specific DNA recombinase
MVGAVIYVRVSTKEQTENLSLPTQLRACEEYSRRQGYEVLERFQRGRRERQVYGLQPAPEPADVLSVE